MPINLTGILPLPLYHQRIVKSQCKIHLLRGETVVLNNGLKGLSSYFKFYQNTGEDHLSGFL